MVVINYKINVNGVLYHTTVNNIPDDAKVINISMDIGHDQKTNQQNNQQTNQQTNPENIIIDVNQLINNVPNVDNSLMQFDNEHNTDPDDEEPSTEEEYSEPDNEDPVTEDKNNEDVKEYTLTSNPLNNNLNQRFDWKFYLKNTNMYNNLNEEKKMFADMYIELCELLESFLYNKYLNEKTQEIINLRHIFYTHELTMVKKLSDSTYDKLISLLGAEEDTNINILKNTLVAAKNNLVNDLLTVLLNPNCLCGFCH